MPTAKIDRVDFLSARERLGALVSYSRRVRVIGITDTDYKALQSALAVSGMPASGSTLENAPNLTLVDRNPTLVEGEPGVVDVDLIYETADNQSVGNPSGQNINNPLSDVVVGQVRVNMQQVETNKDIDGAAITVSHTWPNTAQEIESGRSGSTDTQGGVVSVLIPQRTFTTQGLKETSRPWIIANAMIGRINQSSWMGEDAHTWMCIGIGWQIFDRAAGANRYQMEFEFQHNPDTWNPTAVFIDPTTGKPPERLVVGEGIKTVRIHSAINFERVLGSRIQGG